jgi:hypothetical protein
MKNSYLLCLVLAVLPLCAAARGKHQPDARDDFKLSNPCPSTGAIEAHGCPGWTIGYFTPLCAGGLGTKENMHWITVEDARLIRHLNGKNCKNVKGKSPPSVAY